MADKRNTNQLKKEWREKSIPDLEKIRDDLNHEKMRLNILRSRGTTRFEKGESIKRRRKLVAIINTIITEKKNAA